MTDALDVETATESHAINAGIKLLGTTWEELIEEGLRNEAAGVHQLTEEQRKDFVYGYELAARSPATSKPMIYRIMLEDLGRPKENLNEIEEIMRALMASMMLELCREKARAASAIAETRRIRWETEALKEYAVGNVIYLNSKHH